MDNENNTVSKAKEYYEQPMVKLTSALTEEYESLINKLKEMDTNISNLEQEHSQKLEQLRIKKKVLEEAIQHIRALLHFEGYQVDHYKENGDSSEVFTLETLSIADSAFALLEELHKPLHYKEITSMIQERNINIPGKNPAATLLSRINRDKRFRRSKNRGVYILSTWRIRRKKSKSTKRKTKK
jgi:hypothetical protein